MLSKRKLKKDTATKQKYLKYYQSVKNKRNAMTYAQWKNQGKETARTQSVSNSLRSAGVDEATLRRLKGK